LRLSRGKISLFLQVLLGTTEEFKDEVELLCERSSNYETKQINEWAIILLGIVGNVEAFLLLFLVKNYKTLVIKVYIFYKKSELFEGLTKFKSNENKVNYVCAYFQIHYIYMCVCVCVCVCARARVYIYILVV
jgi:hypothetical protein